MTCGIYGYWDTYKDILVYIGQSKNIEKRHIGHMSPSAIDAQPINRILQLNIDRYELFLLLECDMQELNTQEILAIDMYNPLFNFTQGGQSFSNQHPWNKGKKHPQASKYMKENNPVYKDGVINKIVSTNRENGFYERWSDYMKKHNHMKNQYGNKHHHYGKILSSNPTGVLHLSISRNTKLKQGFYFIYTITNRGNCIYKKTSVNIIKLKNKVEKDGYKWEIQDKDKYSNMMEYYYNNQISRWYNER